MRILLILCILSLLLLFQNCKKDEDNFSFCTDCPISSWVGYYGGAGSYFTVNSGKTTEGIVVDVNIHNPYDSTLIIKIEAENYISESFSTSKKDDNYYILVGAGSETLDIGLRRNGDQYQVSGTLKKNTWNKIDIVWIVNQSLTFSAMKQ